MARQRENIKLRSDLQRFDDSAWRRNDAETRRLCDAVVELLTKRDGITRRALFRIVKQTEFTKHVRKYAEQFGNRHHGLAAYVYVHAKFALLADALRHTKERGSGTSKGKGKRG
jgi:hypothetical protein